VLNYIWLTLVLLAVAIGGWNDRLKDVSEGALDGAKTAVTIALALIGIMALWLGVKSWVGSHWSFAACFSRCSFCGWYRQVSSIFRCPRRRRPRIPFCPERERIVVFNDATASALSAEIFPSPAGELILYRPTFRK
jgi:hypothetical protein